VLKIPGSGFAIFRVGLPFRHARTEDIWDEVDKRARLELKLFLHQAGFDQMEFC
jgi:hypothetical protein